MKQVRDTNIELLRIITMCGVVLLHYNGYVGQALSLVAPGSWNHGILLGFEGFFVCAVNLFVLITGYFSCTSMRRDPVKAFGLILQVCLFGAGIYVLRSFLQGTFNIKVLLINLLPKNYFVILYVVLYIVSPYINLVLEKLDRKQLGKLLIVAVVLFSVLPTLADLLEFTLGLSDTGLNTVGAYGDSFGYTIVNFMLLYLVGAYIRLADVRIKWYHSFAAVVVISALLAYTGKFNSGGIAWSYCNPLVICQAAAVFLLFRQLPLRSRIINELSKGAFTCFLVHPVLLGFAQVSWAVQAKPVVLVGHILLCCMGIYLISWVVYRVYEFVSHPILRLVGFVFKKIRLDFSVESPREK